MEFHIKLVLLKKFLTQNVSNTDSLYHRPKRRKKHRGRTSPLDCLDVFNFDLALTLIGFAGCITLINATEHTGSNEIITLSQNIAQSPRNMGSENNSNARNTQLTKDNGDESLDVPFPARSFHDKVTDTRPVDDMVVSFAQKAQPPVVHRDKIVARVGDIIHANPLLKLLNMFQHDADQQSVVDITKPDWYRELVMLPSTDHLPALKRSLTKQPTESSTPLSNGKETLTFFDRFGSDAAVAKAYASLTESRTSHGTEDNFDEIYQIFNATMFHDAIPKENIIENVKQPYPPLPLLYGTTQIDLPSITTTKSTTVIPDLITSIMTNSYSSTISPTWPETASTPFNHTLFDQQMLATTITALATASSLSTSTPSTTRRYSPKSTIRKNRLLTTTNLALINTSSNITGTTTRISRVPSLVTTKFPLSTTPTASPGKFHTEDPLGNRTRPVSSWSIELESETPPFEITESLETALSTVPTTTKLNSKSTRMDWWFLRTTTPKPTTTQQASPQITTHVPLKTQSVTNPPVMMQQEAYPAKELVSSKNQIYPWERQRELLVPFSESARAGKGPQLQFNDKNISVDTWTTTKSPEVHSPPTLRPFPPVMPGASFYVDQHVSHGHFGREAGTMPVVYDPNVLQSRYGFSGMLPLSHMPKEHTNKLLVDIQPTYHQKKIRKPTTFGVQNLPIGYTPHSKVRFPVTNQYFVDFSKAAYFFIPPPVKLSTAKAIKIRAQSRPSFVIGTVPPVTWTSTPTTTVASTTTSETQRTMAMFGDHLNWRPLGTGPRKFGPAKLIPLAESERNPELNQNGLVEENKLAEKSGTTTERRIDIESYDDFSSKGSSKCLREDPMHLDDLSPALIPAVKACFIRTRECLLHEVTPLERRINFNEEQCINFCGQHAYCNSVVYSKSMAICDIFNLRNGTGNAHLVHHHDYHYYEPKQWANGTKAIEDCWQGKIC